MRLRLSRPPLNSVVRLQANELGVVRLRILIVIMGVLLLIVGLGAVVYSERLMSMCQKHCWFNGLLYAFFGEHNGKLILGAVWYLLGVVLIYLGLFMPRASRKEGA